MIPNTYGAKMSHRFPKVDMTCAVYHLHVYDQANAKDVSDGLIRNGASQYGNWYFHHGTDVWRAKSEILVVDCLYNFEEVCNRYAKELAKAGMSWRDIFSVRHVDTPHPYAWMIDFVSAGILMLPYTDYALGTVNPIREKVFGSLKPEDDIELPEWVAEEITNNKLKYYAKRKQSN